jgi:hypothetical protein
MRTEDQLRTTLVDLADRPHPTDDLYDSIIRRTQRQPVQRRRTALVLAVAAVLIAVAIAVPTFLVNRTGIPADQRVRGNWNQIHRVDLPTGWEVRSITVTADSESTGVGPPTASPDDQTGGCVITVYGRGVGDPAAGAVKRTPVEVNGRPGTYAPPGMETDGGVLWQYADDSWAQASCDGREQSLDLAQRVRFEVTTSRLPFELRSLPDGYQVRAVYPPVPGSPDALFGAIDATSLDQRKDLPAFGVVVSAGTTEIPEHIAGWESDTIAGMPAVLSARDGRLCLNPPGSPTHTVCIESGEGTPADLTKSLWPAGRRELLVEIAESLKLAENLDDQRTWFDANDALPS